MATATVICKANGMITPMPNSRLITAGVAVSIVAAMMGTTTVVRADPASGIPVGDQYWLQEEISSPAL